MKCTRHLGGSGGWCWRSGGTSVVEPAQHSGAIVVVLAQWDKGTAGADLWFKSVPSTKTSGEVLINRCTFNFAISHRCWRVVGCAIETDDVPDSILAPQEPNIMDCTYPSHLLYAAFLCILTKYNISVHFNKMQYFSMYYIVMQQCSLRMFDTMWCVAMQHCAMDSVVSFKELHYLTTIPCSRSHSAVFPLTVPLLSLFALLTITNEDPSWISATILAPVCLSTLSRLLIRTWRECATLLDSPVQFHQHCIIRLPWGPAE